MSELWLVVCDVHRRGLVWSGLVASHRTPVIISILFYGPPFIIQADFPTCYDSIKLLPHYFYCKNQPFNQLKQRLWASNNYIEQAFTIKWKFPRKFAQ